MEPCRKLVSGYQSGGPYNKDCNIWGCILGSPLFGNYHIDMLPHNVLGFRVLGCRVDRVCKAAQG